MRRDLSLGCSSCRLRFSAALAGCPACGRAAMPVSEARSRVEPPTRAAWLAKWAIVVAFVPAFGAVAWTTFSTSEALLPLKNAMGVLMVVISVFALFAGTSIVLAIPFGLWVGLVSLIRLLVGRFVDAPARALRPTVDHAPRKTAGRAPGRGTSSPVGLWEKVSAVSKGGMKRALLWGLPALFVLEILAEVFGEKSMLDFSGIPAFMGSLLVLLLVNGLLLAFAFIPASFVFGGFVWFFAWLARPPALFGKGAAPAVANDALVAQWCRGRLRVEGRAEPLREDERSALARRERPRRVTGEGRAELRSPASGEPCLAFRLVGESGAENVDDADAVGFAVVADDGRRFLVDVADVVVALAAQTEVPRLVDPGFLVARGLPTEQLSLREGLLCPQDRVCVTGHGSSVAVAGEGYRQASRIDVLDEGDGSPVVVVRVGD